MTNKLKQKQSHSLILDQFGRNPATQNGFIICIYLFLMFRSLPYTAAQTTNQPQQQQQQQQQQTPVVPYRFNYTYDPSALIVIVVITSAFLIMFFTSICIHHCARTRYNESIRSNGLEIGRSRRRQRGLDPAVIETFPTFTYSYVKGHKLGKEALECAICLNEFEGEDPIRLLPKCDHVFHSNCIDAWLSKRKTCPVCRANLVPDEIPATTIPVRDIEADSDTENPISEPGDAENQQVEELQVVVVVTPEVINQTPMQNRPARSKSPKYVGRFPRSHSTGHSLVQPGEDVERFTLRLPDEVRKQIMNMRQLNRTRSMQSFPSLRSPMKGNRMKPDGWVFSMTPPFFMKASSPRLRKMTAEGDAPATPSPPPPP